MSSFGDRLRALRVEAGLSQGELAGEQLSASYISLLESGKRSPSSEVVSQLAQRLGCSTTRLVEGEASEREQRISLQLAYARLAMEHGESRDARTRLEQLLAEEGLTRQVRDDATLLAARACQNEGDLPAALRWVLPLYRRCLTAESQVPVTTVAITLCSTYLQAGDLHQASSVGEDALALARQRGLSETDEFYRLAASVMGAYIGLGDFLHARTWAADFLTEAEDSDRQVGQAALYWNAAVLAEYEGRLEEAVRLCERAMGRLGELDNSRDYARLRLAVATVLLACEPPQVIEATNLLERCLDDLRDLGTRLDRGEWNYVAATAMLHQGDAVQAEGRARQAVELLKGTTSAELCNALLVLSDSLDAQGRGEESAEQRAQAFATLREVNGGRALALLWRELGDRMSDAGDHRAAVEAYRQGLDLAGVRDRSRSVRDRVAALRAAPAMEKH